MLPLTRFSKRKIGTKFPAYSVLVTCIVLFASACKKEIITKIREVPLKHSWSYDSSFFGTSKLLLTSVPLNDSVLLVASPTVVYYININKLNKSIEGNYYSFSPFGYLVPPSLTSTLGACIKDSNLLSIFSVNNPVSTGGAINYTPTYIEPVSQKGLPLPSRLGSSGYPIVNSRYMLFPTEFQWQRAYCTLMKFNLTKNFDDTIIDTAFTKQIILQPESSTIGFALSGYYSTTFFGKFFLSYQSQFYRIDTLGNVKSYGYNPVKGSYGQVLSMFTVGNLLFAFNGTSTMWVSQDQGETWSVYSNNIPSVFGFLTFVNVDGNLYAFSQAQIWKFSLSGANLNYVELDTDGLETNQITSINKVGKYVFVTTYAGLYYRDAESFDTPKK